MSSWSVKRRLLYGLGFISIIALIGAGLFWQIFYHRPTCSDNKQNGDETGIDCGGSCQKLCPSDILEPVVLWSKIFHISGDLYTAVAYVENPNVNSKNAKAIYQFKIYNGDNKLITVKDGQTDIPKNKKVAIFETGIVLKQKPKRAELEFTYLSAWEKDNKNEPEISITHSALLSASTTPSITGMIINNSLEIISTIELDAFVEDNSENVIAASRTFIDGLSQGQSEDFVFTWPLPFNIMPSVVQVIYKVL